MATFPPAAPTPQKLEACGQHPGPHTLTSSRCASPEGPGPPRWCGLGRGLAPHKGEKLWLLSRPGGGRTAGQE